jgi:hypothetical protein
VVTLEQQVLTNIHNKLHMIVFAHIGVIILFMALLGAGGWFGLRSYDKQVERAEALQVQFQKAQETAVQAQKQLTDIIAADSAARAQESAQQSQIELEMAKRASQAPAPVVSQALLPTANAQQVATGLSFSFSDESGFGTATALPVGVSLTIPQAQVVVTDHEKEKTLSLTLQGETQLFSLEQQKTASLGKDLAQCQDTDTKDQAALVAANKTIAAFSKIVHQSKFRKVLGSIGRNAERVGILILGVEIGRKI